MPYLILDPVGQYPRQLLHFLGGQAKKAAVAVFTDQMRWMIWRDKWSRELGEYVVDSFLAPQWPTADKPSFHPPSETWLALFRAFGSAGRSSLP